MIYPKARNTRMHTYTHIHTYIHTCIHTYTLTSLDSLSLHSSVKSVAINGFSSGRWRAGFTPGLVYFYTNIQTYIHTYIHLHIHFRSAKLLYEYECLVNECVITLTSTSEIGSTEY